MRTNLICVGCLAFFVASSPIPGQTAKSAAHSKGNSDNRADNKKAPPDALPAISVPVKPDIKEPSSNSPTTTDKPNPVRVTELPPLGLGKDWLDKIAWAGGLVLVGAGVLGVWLANRTLKVIQAQVDATVKAERAWLVVRPDAFILQPGDRLDWLIINTGRTTATISKAQVRCKKYRGMDTLLTGQPDYGGPINLYDVPSAPDIPIKVWSHLEGDTGNRLTAEDVVDIRDRGADLVAYCFVEYSDFFGRSHESRFCYYYAVPFGEFRINLRAPAEYHKCT